MEEDEQIKNICTITKKSKKKKKKNKIINDKEINIISKNDKIEKNNNPAESIIQENLANQKNNNKRKKRNKNRKNKQKNNYKAVENNIDKSKYKLSIFGENYEKLYGNSAYFLSDWYLLDKNKDYGKVISFNNRNYATTEGLMAAIRAESIRLKNLIK